MFKIDTKVRFGRWWQMVTENTHQNLRSLELRTENLPSLLTVSVRVQGATEGPPVPAQLGLAWPGWTKYSREKGLTDPGHSARQRGGASRPDYKVGQTQIYFFILQTGLQSSLV